MSGIMEILVAPSRRAREDALRNIQFRGQMSKFDGPLRRIIRELPKRRKGGLLLKILKPQPVKPQRRAKTRPMRRRVKDIIVEI